MSRRLKTLTEERNRIEESRKEMIAGLAHDLRTPLTSAKGYVEGLIDGIANTPEKREQYLKTIYSSTCDMEKLLDELLTVSKLESDNILLDQKTIRANDFWMIAGLKFQIFSPKTILILNTATTAMTMFLSTLMLTDLKE